MDLKLLLCEEASKYIPVANTDSYTQVVTPSDRTAVHHEIGRLSRTRWCSSAPSSFDLVKIRAKSLNIQAESLKTWAKVGPNVAGFLKKWCPTLLAESHEDLVGGYPNRRSAWENVRTQKWPKHFSGKNLSHPQEFACSYTYGRSNYGVTKWYKTTLSTGLLPLKQLHTSYTARFSGHFENT